MASRAVPDGKAYLLGMGAEEHDPQPRPCIKLGKPGEVFQVVEGCTDDFAHANLSWITADQVYLARVNPSPESLCLHEVRLLPPKERQNGKEPDAAGSK